MSVLLDKLRATESTDWQLCRTAAAEIDRLTAENARLTAEVTRLRVYAVDYGNATGQCASGYLQQSGLVCHRCGADDYNFGCPLAPKEETT